MSSDVSPLKLDWFVWKAVSRSALCQKAPTSIQIPTAVWTDVSPCIVWKRHRKVGIYILFGSKPKVVSCSKFISVTINCLKVAQKSALKLPKHPKNLQSCQIANSGPSALNSEEFISPCSNLKKLSRALVRKQESSGLASTLDLEHQRPNSKSRSPLHHNWTEFK